MMTHDRQIVISVGNSRKDTVWVQTTLNVSDLYNRLSTTVRGTETLETYMKLPKSKQDDLKDIGGFVGALWCGAFELVIGIFAVAKTPCARALLSSETALLLSCPPPI